MTMRETKYSSSLMLTSLFFLTFTIATLPAGDGDLLFIYQRSSLNGKSLRITAADLSIAGTLAIRNSSKAIVGFTGILIKELEWIAHHLNFTYDISPAKDNIAGTRIDGKWNGMIGELFRGEKDLALGPFGIAYERFLGMDFAAFGNGDESILAIPYPNKEKSLFAATEPFNIEVWIALVASFILICFTSYTYAGIRNRYLKSDVKESDKASGSFMMIYYITTITSQGAYYNGRGRSLGVLAFVWCLAAFFLVNSYLCTLVSYLSATYTRPVVSTFREVAHRHDISVYTLKSSISDIDISTSTSADLKIIAERMNRCSDCRQGSIMGALSKTMRPDSVAILTGVATRALLDKVPTQTSQQCPLTLGRDRIGWKPMFFGVPKSSPYVEDLNRASYWFVSHGLYMYWRRELGIPYVHKCELRYAANSGAQKETKNSPLSLKQFYFSFILLIIGCSFSLAVFFIENIHYWIISNQEKVTQQ